MIHREPVLADSVPVQQGMLYVANNKPVISAIGTSGAPKTVADLKTLLGVTTIKQCNVAERRHAFSDGSTLLEK